MSPLVLLLVVAGALAHATWNLVVKRSAASGAAFVWLSAVASAVLLLPAAIVVGVLDPPAVPTLLLAVVVSGALHVAYFLALQAGYRVGDVSVVYPLARGTGPLLSVIVAVLVLGERPGILALLGALAVVAGVVVIGTGGGTSGRRDARAGVLWGLLVGVVIAAYTLWDARAVTALALSPILLQAGATAAQAVLLAPVAVRRRAQVRDLLRTRWREAIVVGVLSPLSYVLILFALQLAPVSVVAPARELSVVFVALAGWLLFRERHAGARIAGSAVVVLGVGLLAASR